MEVIGQCLYIKLTDIPHRQAQCARDRPVCQIRAVSGPMMVGMVIDICIPVVPQRTVEVYGLHCAFRACVHLTDKFSLIEAFREWGQLVLFYLAGGRDQSEPGIDIILPAVSDHAGHIVPIPPRAGRLYIFDQLTLCDKDAVDLRLSDEPLAGRPHPDEKIPSHELIVEIRVQIVGQTARKQSAGSESGFLHEDSVFVFGEMPVGLQKVDDRKHAHHDDKNRRRHDIGDF